MFIYIWIFQYYYQPRNSLNSLIYHFHDRLRRWNKFTKKNHSCDNLSRRSLSLKMNLAGVYCRCRCGRLPTAIWPSLYSLCITLFSELHPFLSLTSSIGYEKGRVHLETCLALCYSYDVWWYSIEISVGWSTIHKCKFIKCKWNMLLHGRVLRCA